MNRRSPISRSLPLSYRRYSLPDTAGVFLTCQRALNRALGIYHPWPDYCYQLSVPYVFIQLHVNPRATVFSLYASNIINVLLCMYAYVVIATFFGE